jgi:hypothetical protein
MHMGVFNKRLSEIDFETINELVSSKVLESKYLDYKQDISHTLKNNETKINILKDIVSFANAQGGDIIIGVGEKNGVPDKITGIDITKVDEIKRTIESIASGGVNPRIPKYEFNNLIPLPTDSEKVILILRIHRSYNTPHMLVYKDENRFWHRGIAKNEMMDLQQIKASIDYSQSLEEKVKGFLMDRINVIESDEIPYELLETAKTLIHFIPISNFLDKTEQVDLSKILKENDGVYSGITEWSGANHQYNINGLVKGAVSHNQQLYSSYVQYFKNGIIESVDNHFLIRKNEKEYSGIIPTRLFEKELSQRVMPQFLDLLKRNNLPTPIWIMITLLNVKNFNAINESLLRTFPKNSIVRKNILHFPVIIIEDYEEKLINKLLPVFNFLANLAGYDKTNSFDSEGNFIERR